MPIGTLTVEFEIPYAQSIKDRRQVLRSLKDRLRHNFNVSVAELDEAVVWNRATLGLVAISRSTPYLRGQLEALERALHSYASQHGAQIADLFAEILHETPDEAPDEPDPAPQSP